MSPDGPVLEVDGLKISFPTLRGRVRAVQGVSFSIARGEVMGLVGESGSGKSTVAHAIVRVLPRAAEHSGRVLFQGADVMKMDTQQLRHYRWANVSLVMQGAMNALNPVMTIERQIVDVVRSHEHLSRRLAKERVPELLELVGIDPSRRMSYPHELSGGMRQRCVIAIALALRPDLVIMDEPTTALDVVVQRGIMDELDRLRGELGFSALLISHDLELVAERASQIAIMYAGRIVELGSARAVVENPLHPYTVALLGASAPLEGPVERLSELPGRPPDLLQDVVGCSFFPRCSRAALGHDLETPTLKEVEPGHFVACHLYAQLELVH
jgi:peptide/nickel transport system ATP-binding protein